jgi:hypothetical protein
MVEGRALLHPQNATREGTPAAELEKLPDFFDLAGSVPVPSGSMPGDWPAERAAAWSAAMRDRA